MHAAELAALVPLGKVSYHGYALARYYQNIGKRRPQTLRSSYSPAANRNYECSSRGVVSMQKCYCSTLDAGRWLRISSNRQPIW